VEFEWDPQKAALNLVVVHTIEPIVCGSSMLALQREPKRRNMKKVKNQAANGDMRPEYDFSGAVRGKYYERFRQSSNVVLLDPDVSEAFPNSESVNQALRALSAARKSGRVMRRPSSPKRRPNERMQLTRSAKAKRRRPRS
jgi:hypothetical protein